MLSVVILSVVMLSVVMLSVIMLSVYILSVVMLSVVAPCAPDSQLTERKRVREREMLFHRRL